MLIEELRAVMFLTGSRSIKDLKTARYLLLSPLLKSHLGELLWDWGIPTAVALLEARRSVKSSIIASGGLRNGLDIAKCIALGADMCALAYPFLKHANESKESALKYAKMLIEELRAVMFLTGSRSIKDLKTARYLLLSPLLDWFKV
jgi:isopentenyl-diphosphate delta-isomerase